jgi:hypothetical protein
VAQDELWGVISEIEHNIPYKGLYDNSWDDDCEDENECRPGIERLRVAVDSAREYMRSLLLELEGVHTTKDFYWALCFGIDSDVCVHYTEEDIKKRFYGELTSVSNGLANIKGAQAEEIGIEIKNIQEIEILKEKGGKPYAGFDNERNGNRQSHRGERMRRMH